MKIGNVFALIRVRISLMSALSAAAGYVFFSFVMDRRVFVIFSGVFLLASSASAFNQYQEREIDSIMERTMHRPIPSGIISVSEALIFAFLSGMSGLLIIYSLSPFAAAAGLVAVIIYNLIYTPLKPISRYCILAGALAGSIPPVMGWLSAGGHLNESFVLLLFCFFYVWQIPHSIAISVKYDDQFREAGLPVFTDVLSHRQLRSIAISWMLSCFCIGLLMLYRSLGENACLIVIPLVLMLLISLIGPARRLVFIKL